MIIEINKEYNKLKLGVIGTRSDLFKKVLDKNNIEYTSLENFDEIDETYDFVFESGLYKIIPEDILSKPKYGFVGTHETPIPEGRGHAPIQWTVSNNRKNMVVTLYKLDKDVDTGSIICQHNVHFKKTDGLAEMNEKRENAIEEVFSVFIDELKNGFLVLRKQSGKGSYNKKKTPEHSELNTNKTLGELWDEIRVCDNEKYPAWFTILDKKIILKYYILEKHE